MLLTDPGERVQRNATKGFPIPIPTKIPSSRPSFKAVNSCWVLVESVETP